MDYLDLVNKRLGQSVTHHRKKAIASSLARTNLTDVNELNSLIDKLATRKRHTVLGYSEKFNECINCNGRMINVYLFRKRPAVYCEKCRIALPTPVSKGQG